MIHPAAHLIMKFHHINPLCVYFETANLNLLGHSVQNNHDSVHFYLALKEKVGKKWKQDLGL